jgi:hypothetical protein
MTGLCLAGNKVIVKDRLTAEQSEIRPRADSKATREVGGCEEMLESWHWNFQSNLQNPVAVSILSGTAAIFWYFIGCTVRR